MNPPCRIIYVGLDTLPSRRWSITAHSLSIGTLSREYCMKRGGKGNFTVEKLNKHTSAK